MAPGLILFCDLLPYGQNLYLYIAMIAVSAKPTLFLLTIFSVLYSLIDIYRLHFAVSQLLVRDWKVHRPLMHSKVVNFLGYKFIVLISFGSWKIYWTIDFTWVLKIFSVYFQNSSMLFSAHQSWKTVYTLKSWHCWSRARHQCNFLIFVSDFFSCFLNISRSHYPERASVSDFKDASGNSDELFDLFILSMFFAFNLPFVQFFKRFSFLGITGPIAKGFDSMSKIPQILFKDDRAFSLLHQELPHILVLCFP